MKRKTYNLRCKTGRANFIEAWNYAVFRRMVDGHLKMRWRLKSVQRIWPAIRKFRKLELRLAVRDTRKNMNQLKDVEWGYIKYWDGYYATMDGVICPNIEFEGLDMAERVVCCMNAHIGTKLHTIAPTINVVYVEDM